MKRLIATGMLAVVLIVAQKKQALATNGDQMMGVGVISRSMGGVGVAISQDAANAVFSNPAAVLGKQAFFSATWFAPEISTSIMNTSFVESQMQPFLIPAIGISHPISDAVNFGLAFAGSSGMGTDYRDIASAGNMYTYLTVMKLAPRLSWQITPNLSAGASVQVAWSALDLGKGVSHGYGVGSSFGLKYIMEPVTIGVAYSTGETVNHKRVFDLDGNGKLDSLKLASPQTAALGIAWEPLPDLLLEGNVKFLNWADANGYEDFDWDNQWVYALGVQYRLPDTGLSLRSGFNYGKNPVKTHNGWDAANPGEFSKEFLRTVGVPAVVETHITAGAGYQISDGLSLDVGYSRGVSKKFRETSSAASGSVVLESEVAEDSYEVGLSWRY